ncbi:MAG: acyltransferase [Bacteroidales bacterium]|nr:acyltransferase [Bacteroidales bacterium]
MEKLSLKQRLGRWVSLSVSQYHRFRGCEIGRNCRISKSALIDRVNPRGVHIGDNTRVLLEAWILAHDYSHGVDIQSIRMDTYIGHHCVIGGRSVIMPGVRIGNHVYVGVGSIVTHSVPDHCIVAGNPARIIRRGTIISDRGQIIEKGESVRE